ncbi:hypothetical protein DFP72DRAFT_1076925 [Ephemerocybe angulata]|uniref:Uncharacterized protein n=1 Tax=Ephemerocybe angulata TaxID=980116 RepID=A0A8H6HG49_9AGAR|nr:hypothetical protein DFP72DRAFT_1076925 [Tulosesus angulatus]
MNPITGPLPLEAPTSNISPFDWTAPELLCTAPLLYSLASEISWQCVLLKSREPFLQVQKAVHRPTNYPGESRRPAELIRCLDLAFEDPVLWGLIPSLVGPLCNLKTIIFSGRTRSFRYFYDLPPSLLMPNPHPSPFPASLTSVLFSSPTFAVTMGDLKLLSVMVPQLERLQVTVFLPAGGTLEQSFFPSLRWLSIGGFRRLVNDIEQPSSSSLTTLLSALSVGSGLRNLVRLDILTDMRLPDTFLDTHGPSLKILSIPSHHHRCIRAWSVFPRFTALEKLIILLEPKISALPRNPNIHLQEIVFICPPLPFISNRPNEADFAILTQVDYFIADIVSVAEAYAALRRIAVSIPQWTPASDEWLRAQRERLAPHNIAITLSVGERLGP